MLVAENFRNRRPKSQWLSFGLVKNCNKNTQLCLWFFVSKSLLAEKRPFEVLSEILANKIGMWLKLRLALEAFWAFACCMCPQLRLVENGICHLASGPNWATEGFYLQAPAQDSHIDFGKTTPECRSKHLCDFAHMDLCALQSQPQVRRSNWTHLKQAG